MEADSGRAGGDKTFGDNFLELYGLFSGKSKDTTPVYTQGYLHLFLTITATRSTSSSETKEEIVSKYVIALNEVKYDTHKSDL